MLLLLQAFTMIKESIRRVNGYQHDAYTYYPVIIVGAGASGIAMACQLKQQLGFDQFRVFDRQAGIGGTVREFHVRNACETHTDFVHSPLVVDQSLPRSRVVSTRLTASPLS